MQLIRTLSSTPDSLKQAVIALGNFDGLHPGHLAILHHTLATAKTMEAPAAVMSFEPHPREFFNPDAPKLRLMRLKEKIRALQEMGFDALFLPHFNAKLAATSAEDFVQTLLVDMLKARHIVTGNNFCFGKGREGNCSFLAQASEAKGFGYDAIDAVDDDEGRIVSSSSIRAALENGNVSLAAQLLGRPFAICGHVTHGDKRGRSLGFPTANVPLETLFVPKAGVYAVRVQIGNEYVNGVANIGMRPTFNGTKPRLEAFLFGFSRDIYGCYIRAHLVAFIRPEQRFNSLQQMTAQLQADTIQAKELLQT